MQYNIEDWLQPQHVSREAILYLHNRLPSEFNDGVLLDNFLNEEKLSRLYHFVENEATFAPLYKIRNRRESVTEEVFLSTPEVDRFLSRRRVTGLKANFEMSPNWLTYRSFLEFCKNILPGYLSACTNCALTLESQVTHSHTYRNFLKPHSDVLQGRKICIVFYLSKGWCPEDGGQFIMEREGGNNLLIEATYNRLNIFIPSDQTYHYVARHTEQAKAKNRICHVAWYKEATDFA